MLGLGIIPQIQHLCDCVLNRTVVLGCFLEFLRDVELRVGVELYTVRMDDRNIVGDTILYFIRVLRKRTSYAARYKPLETKFIYFHRFLLSDKDEVANIELVLVHMSFLVVLLDGFLT